MASVWVGAFTDRDLAESAALRAIVMEVDDHHVMEIVEMEADRFGVEGQSRELRRTDKAGVCDEIWWHAWEWPEGFVSTVGRSRFEDPTPVKFGCGNIDRVVWESGGVVMRPDFDESVAEEVLRQIKVGDRWSYRVGVLVAGPGYFGDVAAPITRRERLSRPLFWFAYYRERS